MKKIGIIGGIGPESTIDYYKLIINHFHKKQADIGYPEIIIYSANMSSLIKILEANDWENLITWLLEKVFALYRAGAEFVAIGANTPHIVFDEVSSRSPVPMVSIINETYKIVKKRGFNKIGLLGTKFTMELDFFKKPFRDNGISIFVPEKEEQIFIQHKLLSEIELGIVKDITRNGLLSIIKNMIDKYSIDALILGCTELPIILNKEQYGIPFLNTTKIHVESIVHYCLMG